MRFNWVLARMAALDYDEMRDLVLDAWRMVVPQRVAAAHDALEPALPDRTRPDRRTRRPTLTGSCEGSHLSGTSNAWSPVQRSPDQCGGPRHRIGRAQQVADLRE